MAALGGVKVLTVAAAVVFWAVLAAEASYDEKDGRHNISLGHRRPGDILILHDDPVLQSKMFRVQSSDVCYPRPGFNRKFSITAFNVTDRKPAGKGGYAYVTKGGVNWGVLCLHLKTQRGGSYNFSVDLWGFYIN